MRATSRRRRQAGDQAFDRFFHARNALPGEQLHAGRALELRQFLLEIEQAQASSGEVCSLPARWRYRAYSERGRLICRSAPSRWFDFERESLRFIAAWLSGLYGADHLKARNLWRDGA